jgi:hypothetical protein
MGKTKKNLAALERSAIAQGWTIQHTSGSKSNRTWWISPTGERILASDSMTEHRAIANHLARLRRAGYTP